MRVGGNTSRSARAFGVLASLGATTPARETSRLSISTKVPDSGRSDQRVSAGGRKKKKKAPPPRRAGAPREGAGGGAPGPPRRRGVGARQPPSPRFDMGR